MIFVLIGRKSLTSLACFNADCFSMTYW